MLLNQAPSEFDYEWPFDTIDPSTITSGFTATKADVTDDYLFNTDTIDNLFNPDIVTNYPCNTETIANYPSPTNCDYETSISYNINNNLFNYELGVSTEERPSYQTQPQLDQTNYPYRPSTSLPSTVSSSFSSYSYTSPHNLSRTTTDTTNTSTSTHSLSPFPSPLPPRRRLGRPQLYPSSPPPPQPPQPAAPPAPRKRGRPRLHSPTIHSSRAQNRLAARRFRARSDAHEAALATQAAELERRNSDLKSEVDGLRQQVLELKNGVLGAAAQDGCECGVVARYLEGELGRMGKVGGKKIGDGK